MNYFTFILTLLLFSPILAAQDSDGPNLNDPEITAWTPSQSPVEDPLHDVFFYGEQLGWAYTYGTGILIHTRDGGQTWQVQHRFHGHESDYYFEQIQFTSERDGWLIGDYGYIYRTKDGGQSWQDLSPGFPGRLKGPKDTSANGVRVLYYGMYFRTGNEGFVSGQKFKQGERSFKEYVLNRTSDGGFSWHRPARALPAMMFDIQFPEDRTGFAVSKSRVWSTKDRGRNWTEKFSDNPVTNCGKLRGLFCFDMKRVLACSENGKILRTVDGGKNWKSIQVTSNRLRSLVFRDDLNGFAVGDKNKEDGVLHVSNDGGESWKTTPFDLPDLHRICLSPSKVWAVGKEGVIISRDR